MKHGTLGRALKRTASFRANNKILPTACFRQTIGRQRRVGDKNAAAVEGEGEEVEEEEQEDLSEHNVPRAPRGGNFYEIHKQFTRDFDDRP